MRTPYLCVPDEDNSFYDLSVRYNLSPELIFVFGSNVAGIHGKGAAKTAVKTYGAIYGKGNGCMGNCYAIPTKDRKIRTLPLDVIESFVKEFIEYSKLSGKYFYVTPIGTGLAGYKHEDIAHMFKDVKNCWLPLQWRHLILSKEEIMNRLKDNKRCQIK